MGKKKTTKNQQSILESLPFGWANIVKEEKLFIGLIGLFFFIAGAVFPYPAVAMWVGFAFAGYSAIANDSIQTIGTFLASNHHRKWWVLWLFIGGIFVVTVTWSWFNFDGDVSYGRLLSKGFDETPVSFSFLQVAAPIFLLILTRMRMPVSTTFLLLSSFSTSAGAIGGVLMKSLSGYFVAFTVAIISWVILSNLIRKYFKGKAHPIWPLLQWVTSGSLWAVWLMQDAANIAVYLPRSLSVSHFLGFTLFIFFGLGLLFYLRGDKIQQIVTEKSHVTDIRSATLIDFIYAILLYYFKGISNIPMSTTWVFIGLLAGREIAMSITDGNGKGSKHGKTYRQSLKMILKDASYATIGLIVSIMLAMSINIEVRKELLGWIGLN